jgi:hypothetical protein
MSIKVLALASGVTTLADHRVLNGAMMTSNGTLAVRSGVLPGAASGALSTVSAMVARVAPVKVLIANSISAALGPYLLVSDANVDITFDAGEASVPRVDRIIARAYDDTNDGSGSTTGSIYYLKGQASGTATSLPNNSVLLYEMTIPAGASAGSGGVNFANAVDQRAYTVAQGGIFPVASNTEMAAIGNPYEGMTVYRTDLDAIYVYDGTNFKLRGTANVASSANLTNINNPYDGAIAVTRNDEAIWIYNGTTWVQPKTIVKPVVRLVAQSSQSAASNTTVQVQFGTSSEIIDNYNFHSEVTNNTRVTPSVAGYYKVTGHAAFGARDDYRITDSYLRLNGTTTVPGSSGRVNYPTFSGTNSTTSSSVMTHSEAIIAFNGTTDYVELMAVQTNVAAANPNLVVSGQFASVLQLEYLGPTTY